jgi:hypothetical protein
MGQWGQYTFLDFTTPEGDFVNGMVSNETIAEQTEVLNNAYNGFGYSFSVGSIDSAVNAGWYYATDSHKFETGQWENDDQFLAMTEVMTVDVPTSINFFWTGASMTAGLGVHPWSFPEDDPHHGLYCANYTIPGGTEPFTEGCITLLKMDVIIREMKLTILPTRKRQIQDVLPIPIPAIVMMM